VKTSANGLHFLEQNEGRVLRVYLDTSRIPTCGVGHRVLPSDGLELGDTITEDECEAFLAHDVGKSEDAINGSVRVPISQSQFDALVSLTFNIGVYAFEHSTVLADLNAGNVADERRAFELWDKDMQKQHLVVDAALLARRDREVALFMAPDDVPDDVA
jgi:lysozyme